MANLNQIQTSFESLLTQTTGVTKWDTIQFSMLPKEQPKGYLQMTQVQYGALSTSEWLVGIGIAELTLEALNARVYHLLEAIEANLYSPNPCLEGGGSVAINGPIQVEIPDSYANQSGISNTTGFRTAITFQATIQFAR